MHRRTGARFKPRIIAICLLLLLSATGMAATADYSRLPDTTTHEQALTLRLHKLKDLLAQAGTYQRYILLDTAAKTAFELGQYDQATAYAQELIALAAKFQDDWNYSSAVHNANIIMGRAALLKNDINSAKQFLLAAGKVPYSKILDNRGADLQLAGALLARGQRETVNQYLQDCTRLWPHDRNRLEHWRQQLAEGKNPNLLTDQAE
jgi:tetratricopeptide (TPR) repeat protein